MKKLAPFLSSTLALLLLEQTWAARPLQTEEAEPVRPGSCELDAEVGRAREEGVRVRAEAFDFACGAVEGTQLNFGGSQQHAPEGRARSAGLGFKTRLWAGEGDGAPALALAGALGWARAPEAGWRREVDELKLALTLPGRGWTTHLNLGHVRDRVGDRRLTAWGVAAELDPLPWHGLGWAPTAEVYGDDRDQRWAALGLRVTLLPERLFADAAWSRALGAGDAHGWAVGFKVVF